MSDSALSIIANCCQFLTIGCSLCAYVPQWITLYRRKSSDDISLKSWVLWIGCALLGTFYSATTYFTHGVGLALVCTDIAALCFISVTIAMILKYRKAALGTQIELREPIEAIVARTGEIDFTAEKIANCVRLTGSIAEQRAEPPH